MSRKPSGFIYVVKVAGYYKIGKSKDFRQRMGEYTQLFEKPKVIICKWCRNYHKFEKQLHNKYKAYNTRGEWFKLDFWQVFWLRINILLHSTIRK